VIGRAAACPQLVESCGPSYGLRRMNAPWSTAPWSARQRLNSASGPSGTDAHLPGSRLSGPLRSGFSAWASSCSSRAAHCWICARRV